MLRVDLRLGVGRAARLCLHDKGANPGSRGGVGSGRVAQLAFLRRQGIDPDHVAHALELAAELGVA